MDSNMRPALNQSKKQNLKDLKQNLKKLKKESTTELDQLIDDQTTYETIASTRAMLALDDYNDAVLKLIVDYRSQEKFVQLFDYLCTHRNDLNFLESRYIPDYLFAYKETSVEERRVFNFINLDYIINFILVNSVDYRKFLCKKNSEKKSFLETYISVLYDLDFYQKFTSYHEHGLIILNLNWISKSADDFRTIWSELNSIETILKFAQTFPKFKIYSFSIIANIALDIDLEQIPEINQVVQEYVKYTNECINNPDGRIKQKFEQQDSETSFEVLYIEDKLVKVFNSITGFLRGLYRFAINETIRLEIYNQNSFKRSIKKLILNGVEVEKQHAIQLLAQLSFNQEINNDINEDLELVNYIRGLEKQDVFACKKLQSTCQNLLWILDNNKNKNEIFAKEKASQETETPKDHIMISYNSANREICLKIKAELESLNYKVWIDVNEIHGSSLQSMANAVEDAKCVIMCCTEKYRQSVNCQAEAQYAFRLNRTIIPCIMQTGFHNVKGWLGIIIGDKIFVDFSKYKFEESMKRLIKQIVLNVGKIEPLEPQQQKVVQEEKTSQHDKPIEEQETDKLNEDKPKDEEKAPISNDSAPDTIEAETGETINIDSCLDWTEDQVKFWCAKNDFLKIFDSLKPLNGQILNQLYQLQVHTPEFFFKSLTKHDSIEIKAVASFSYLLKELFDKKQ